MPDEYSNFTHPDAGGPNNGRQGGATRGAGDNGEVWNPTGGPNGTGAWEQPANRESFRSFDKTSYGGRSNDLDGNGNIVQGTSGAARDRDRFIAMGRPAYESGPVMRGPSQGDDARRAGMDALENLSQRAWTGDTPAVRMAQEQTTGAVNAGYSGAASIKGGAMARAAAARGAVSTGARVQATGDQGREALRAREMADASSQYFGASTAQRGQDVDFATKQANLNAGQNAANDGRNSFYEALGFDVQKTELNARLGRSAAEVSSNDAARQATLAREATSAANAARVEGAVIGGATGAASAYDKIRSDPRSKTAVRDLSTSGMSTKTGMKRPGMSDKEAARLKEQGEGIADGWREAAGLSTVSTPGNKSAARGEAEFESPKARLRARAMRADANPYDAPYERGMFARPTDAETEPNTDALHAGIERQITADKPAPAIIRDDPYAPKALFGGGPRGYAASRRGHAGYMFGGAPDAVHGFEKDHRFGMAPGSEDAQSSGKLTNQYDRDIAMSDPAAKQEAYALGRAHQWEQGKTGKPVEWAHARPDDVAEPAVMSGDRGKASKAGGKASSSSVERKDGTAQRADVAARTKQGEDGREYIAKGLAIAPYAPALGAGMVAGGSYAAHDSIAGQGPAPPGAPAQPSYFGGLASRAREMVSDPKTKKSIHDSPMAQANRSMSPSSYEYKPEFTPPEQEQGEENIGPMADKMKADRVAGTAIVTDPESGMLAIDKTKGLKLVMGGLSSLQQQVDRLEARKSAKGNR